MNIVLGLIAICVVPLLGAYLGKSILKGRWLSCRTRVFFASTLVIALCAGLWIYSPWAAVVAGLLGLFALREGRAYPVHQPFDYGDYALGPHGMFRPRVSDGVTWGDVHRRDRTVIPWSQKSDLHEMQEGALGSIGSAAGKRFEQYPPVIHRQRPGHVRLAVDNGFFPPKGASAKRGQLKSVK